LLSKGARWLRSRAHSLQLFHGAHALNEYTDELRTVVARKYKIDFDTFGYAV
jgi:hypothetical protein